MTAAHGLTTQSNPRPYGDDLGAVFGARKAASLLNRSFSEAEIAITEIKLDRSFGQPTSPGPQRDGYIISFPILGQERMGYWEEGRHLGELDLAAGAVTVHDCRRQPMVFIDGPVHTLLWYVSNKALDALAEDASVPRIGGLRHDATPGNFDGTISAINLSLLAALKAPEHANRLFVDHVTLAFATHVAQTYGGMEAAARLVEGGLAPWQERRAKEMLLADLTGAIPLAEISAACRLSSSHFARAFRRSAGLAPHAWLLQARIERSMILLRENRLSLSEIALVCGFVDQSHFTRVFVRRVSMTPGAWRRMVFS
ncbi:MAG: AraC family transcriptional regulator [Phenylobacterium sp.]|nr:MAG: AraC family transcriptional regulator [Phenylobacterium sp.]